MKCKGKSWIGICALTTSILFGLPITKQVFKPKVRDSIKPYIKTNLEEIMSTQEKELGIKHFGKPDIIFSEYVGDFYGLYLREYDIICLNQGVLITSEDNFANNLFKFLGTRKSDAKEVLDHELGHFYTDKLSEYLGYGNWPPSCLKYMPYNQMLCFKLISEGIAEYFSRKISGKEDNFKDSDWPESIEDFCNKTVYDGGYHLVKPIIDKHGKDAIEYLMINPPPDLMKLLEYQKKALEDLSR